MKNNNNKKVFILCTFLIIILGFLVIYKMNLKIDKLNIKLNNVKTETKLKGNIIETSKQEAKGYDEVDYEISYMLSKVDNLEKSDVVIEGELSKEESKYTSFKKIEGTNIVSKLNDDKNKIEVTIKDVKVNVLKKITLKLSIENAPNDFKVNPSITIKPKNGQEEKLQTKEVILKTNSLTGLVLDENKIKLSNIELSINKNNEEISRNIYK